MSSPELIIPMLTLGLIFTLTPPLLAFARTRQKFYFNLVLLFSLLWAIGIFILWMFLTDNISQLKDLTLKEALFLAIFVLLLLSLKTAFQRVSHNFYNRKKRQ